MLVIFTSKAYADITMFGDIAKKFIKFMGHSGTIPSAIKAEDIDVALHKLKAAVEQSDDDVESTANDDDESHVSLKVRAIPLIKLLEASSSQNVGVMWDSK